MLPPLLIRAVLCTVRATFEHRVLSTNITTESTWIIKSTRLIKKKNIFTREFSSCYARFAHGSSNGCKCNNGAKEKKQKREILLRITLENEGDIEEEGHEVCESDIRGCIKVDAELRYYYYM